MKRNNGEGSVYRHGRGWEAAYYVDGRRRTFRARTAREARERLEDVRRQAAEGAAVPDGRMTTATYLEYWLTVVVSTIRPSTHKRYREYIRVHAVPEIGHLRLTELKPMHLQRLYAIRLKAGSSASTVQHLHRTLHRALAMAERWEQVNRNVARLVTPPRVPEYKIRRLTADEVRQLVAAAPGSRFEAAFFVAVATGLRLGELLAMHWSHIELDDDPVVHVRGSLQRTSGKLQVLQPKTSESVRDVASPDRRRRATRTPDPPERRAAEARSRVGGPRPRLPGALCFLAGAVLLLPHHVADR